jgi:hypothetical protein
LNRLPELKQFIKYGGAEAFQNVEVEFNRGRKAVLTINHDGDEHEQVDLQSIATQDEMHQMMLDKGFVLKSDEEVEAMMTQGVKTKTREEQETEILRGESTRRREEIVEEQRVRAETFHGSTKGDELTKLTHRIQTLKKVGGHEDTVKELENRRVELMRMEMLTRQNQLEMSRAAKETKIQKATVEDDEL